MSVPIVNNRIAGTRITIYDVYHYLEGDRSPAEIAEILRLTPEQVQGVIQYIEDHKEEVLAIHRKIEERIARGNPPEIEALREASRAKMEAWLKERRREKQREEDDQRDSGGR